MVSAGDGLTGHWLQSECAALGDRHHVVECGLVNSLDIMVRCYYDQFSLARIIK